MTGCPVLAEFLPVVRGDDHERFLEQIQSRKESPESFESPIDGTDLCGVGPPVGRRFGERGKVREKLGIGCIRAMCLVGMEKEEEEGVALFFDPLRSGGEGFFDPARAL